MERVRPQPATEGERRRMSIFAEVGLVDEDRIREERSPIRTHGHSLRQLRPAKMLRFRSRNDVINERQPGSDESDWESVDEDDEDVSKPTAPIVPTQFTMSTKLYRLGFFSLFLALMLPILSLNPISRIGVRGGVIPGASIEAMAESSMLVRRGDSPTDACKRWGGQSTIVNGTLYMYGFRRTTDAQQSSGTWSMFLQSLLQTKIIGDLY